MPNLPKLSTQRSATASQAVQQLKSILTTPYAIAAFVSIGFHVVVLAAVARSSSAAFAAFGEEGGSEPRTVPLVTLSPAEQGRLPNFNQPQLSSIPDITASTPLRNLPNSTLFNPSTSRLKTPSSSSSSRLNRNRPFNNPYIPRPNLAIRNTPSRSSQSSERRSTPVTNIPVPPSVNERGLSEEEIKKRQLEIEEQQEAAAAEQEAANNPEPAPGLPDLPEQSDEPIAEDTEDVGDNVVAANPEAQIQLSRLEELQASSGVNYDETKTNPETIEENYALWETETPLDEEVTIQTTAETEPVAVGEGLNLLCNQAEPQNGEIGVLVAPDGTPINADILLSTGYADLNEAALDEGFNGRQYAETETATRYRIGVAVNYDHEATCANAAEILESARANQQEAAAE
ncbi:hypothetical protein IQ260_14130 [Leptolyngbya cf. ectocarpi LEGE 11479]|uniref:TonB C-terminal domain-containing protein n=1 Tax=Leptolyngbya cf. ectocarpi LEGE 11479 TaxID=1828722 RepID=A0A929F6Q6_LEPEC|nr:hypothetical protein [Leptolyngbya ectocarpi]MBE9067791.1 hypothetical protein [Leptolyngbya cf. ectocarpi LEGE 11479]